MKRIINIQGTNGSGKSTLARSYISHNGLREQSVYIKTAGNVIVQTNADKSIFVLGKYSGGKCGGCDTIKTTGIVLEALLELVKLFQPEEILFEGILISGNQTFAEKCFKIAKNVGYDFLIIFLDRGADVCINAVGKRNGGKDFNLKQVVDKYRSCERVFKKMNGVCKGKIVNPDNYKRSDLWKCLI